MSADPYSAFIVAARLALVAAGLEQHTLGEGVYFSGGSGAETLVLVHGVNDQAGTWSPVVPALMKRYRLIVPDLPGHGESGPKEGPISLPSIVERIHAIAECENARSVSIAGSSMGAWIAILYALQYPDEVNHLYLESGGGLARVPGVPLTAATREDAQRILRAVHGPNAKLPEWAADALVARSGDAPVHRVMASNVFPHFVDARLGEVRAPVKIIWGEHDGVVPRSYVDDLVKGIRDAKLCVIPGAAHIPHSQQPEKFTACLMETF